MNLESLTVLPTTWDRNLLLSTQTQNSKP